MSPAGTTVGGGVPGAGALGYVLKLTTGTPTTGGELSPNEGKEVAAPISAGVAGGEVEWIRGPAMLTVLWV